MKAQSDNIFQGVLHRTKHTSGSGLKVQRGLIQIHPNENAHLPGLLPTALSKSIISVHERQTSPDLDTMERNHKEFVKDFETSSGMFNFMVFPLDLTKVVVDKAEFASRLTNDLQGTVADTLLSSSSRAIDNYALILVGLAHLVLDMGLSLDDSEKMQNELYEHIVQKCLPRTLTAIETAASKKGRTLIGLSKGDLVKEIVANLKDLTFKDFFQRIFLSRNSVYI